VQVQGEFQESGHLVLEQRCLISVTLHVSEVYGTILRGSKAVSCVRAVSTQLGFAAGLIAAEQHENLHFLTGRYVRPVVPGVLQFEV